MDGPAVLSTGQEAAIKEKVTVAQSFPTLSTLIDCGPPSSSVHGILQARMLERATIPFSKRIFPTQGSNPGLLHCRQLLYYLDFQPGKPQEVTISFPNLVLWRVRKWEPPPSQMKGRLSQLAWPDWLTPQPSLAPLATSALPSPLSPVSRVQPRGLYHCGDPWYCRSDRPHHAARTDLAGEIYPFYSFARPTHDHHDVPHWLIAWG